MTAAKSLSKGDDSEDDFSPFGTVKAWIFDLDNTLYPHHAGLFLQVEERIREKVQRYLNIDREAADKVRQDYYKRYGTTLRGLMVEHNIHPDDFLEYVHDIDHSPVEADPVLTSAIASLPGRKFILTNGSRRHAEKVADRLGFTDHFEDIFDIVSAKLLPKPSRETYERFIATTGVAPTTAAMFEDLPRNLVVPNTLGMRTVLIIPKGTRAVFEDDWEMEGHDADHIDYLTDDLGGFLNTLVGSLGKAAQ